MLTKPPVEGNPALDSKAKALQNNQLLHLPEVPAGTTTVELCNWTVGICERSIASIGPAEAEEAFVVVDADIFSGARY